MDKTGFLGRILIARRGWASAKSVFNDRHNRNDEIGNCSRGVAGGTPAPLAGVNLEVIHAGQHLAFDSDLHPQTIAARLGKGVRK